MEFDIDFSKKDFEKMLIPVHEIPDKGTFIENTPLHKFSDFKNGIRLRSLSTNKLVKWIACVYDKESPFNKFTNLNERKLAALEYCRIDLKKRDGEYNDDVIRVLQCTNKKVNAMIISYARALNDSKYALILALQQRYYNELENIQNGNPTARVNIKILQSELSEEQLEFLNQDNSKNLFKDLEEIVTFENIERRLRPEGIAISLMRGESPISKEEIQEET